MTTVSPRAPAILAGAALLGLTILFGFGVLAMVAFAGGLVALVYRLVTGRGPAIWLLLAIIAAALVLALAGVGGGVSGGSVSQASAQEEIVVTGAEWNCPGCGGYGSISYSDTGCNQAAAGGFWPACSMSWEAPLYQNIDSNGATTSSVKQWWANACAHLSNAPHTIHRCRVRQDSCSNLGCTAWHARVEAVFAYDGQASRHSASAYGTYVQCTVPSSAGYTVTIDYCGWRDVWNNPAPYGNGQHITAQIRYHISFIFSGFPIQQSHAMSWHLYGSGGAYPHPNDHI
jgi:hypothetical protein